MVLLNAVANDRDHGVFLPRRTVRRSLSFDRMLGLAGSAVIVGGGVSAGIAPLGDLTDDLPLVRALRTSTVLSVLVVYVGLTMLLIAWWRIGAAVGTPGGPTCRQLAKTVAWWSAPFAIATPIFSGDIYSYLAQGAMTFAGVDAYRFGPAALGGPLAANVPEIWQHTPAPYGPVFLDLAGAVTAITGRNIWGGILGMRALAVLGLCMLVWSVPRLAGFYGVQPAAAVWLGVLNPLVLLHLVADAHNEAMMLGLMSMGLVLVLQHRPALGVVLITLGALVKAPAALAIAFVVPIWASQIGGRHTRLRAAWRAAGVAAVTAVTVTILAGTGFGWIRILNTPTLARTWMSISTDLGWAVGTLIRRASGLSVDQTRHGFWLAGLALAAVVSVLLWRRSERLGPVTALGLCLGVLVVAGPVVHPWYLLWAVVPLAAAGRETAIRRTVAVGSVALVLMVLPGGVQPGLPAVTGAALGVSMVLLVVAVTGGLDGLGRWPLPTSAARVAAAVFPASRVVAALTPPAAVVESAVGQRSNGLRAAGDRHHAGGIKP